MNNLRHKTERFFFMNRNKGIPNLMLWILIANAVAYIFISMDPSGAMYLALNFNPVKILHGQVWRLFTYAFLDLVGYSPIWLLFYFLFYYQLAKGLENTWGALKFNFYYLTGLLLLDVAGLIFQIPISASSLNLTLFLAFATMYPDMTFLLFFIIPLKARWLGLVALILDAVSLLQLRNFPMNLLPLFSLGNYLLYFGADCLNILPPSWGLRARKSVPHKAKTVPFRKGTDPVSPPHRSAEKPAYTHKCVVCGRTDVSNPELEFRYCSKCKGYQCYCSDHINNHTHIQ